MRSQSIVYLRLQVDSRVGKKGYKREILLMLKESDAWYSN